MQNQSESNLTREQLAELRSRLNELEIISPNNPQGPGLKLLFAQALIDYAPQLIEAAERDLARDTFRPLCETHPGVNYKRDWGCPECVRELRHENEKLRSLALIHRAERHSTH